MFVNSNSRIASATFSSRVSAVLHDGDSETTLEGKGSGGSAIGRVDDVISV